MIRRSAIEIKMVKETKGHITLLYTLSNVRLLFNDVYLRSVKTLKNTQIKRKIIIN